ncbi:DUF4255 domain-containing protein [Aromatoleum diolicum]|uniref:DUF4255 domain-containing protein n=1 Tax=Aromatoleum diolicum TaxID=75796 RepID=A0ABX1QBT9_9RHOO|nr:DUF4255 domain-containing protein [Aromatoleum diolicum]NMG75798.1 DUF4255 domain-containing protein [Aromatoleum diolicum]
MASHLGILAVLQALRERLSIRMAARLGGNPQVEILGSQSLTGTPQPNTDTLGLYVHRVSVDPFSRNRHLPPQPGRHLPRPELPVNLHVMLIAWCTHTEQEISYLATAIQIIGSALSLESADVSLADPDWGHEDSVQVLPEEMSTEDLMRIWDSLPGDYRLSAPYLIKTVRLAPDLDRADGPPVRTLVFPMDERGGTAQ